MTTIGPRDGRDAFAQHPRGAEPPDRNAAGTGS